MVGLKRLLVGSIGVLRDRRGVEVGSRGVGVGRVGVEVGISGVVLGRRRLGAGTTGVLLAGEKSTSLLGRIWESTSLLGNILERLWLERVSARGSLVMAVEEGGEVEDSSSEVAEKMLVVEVGD